MGEITAFFRFPSITTVLIFWAFIMRKSYCVMIELESAAELTGLFNVETSEGRTVPKPLYLGIYAEECPEAVNTMAFRGANRFAPESLLTVARIQRHLIPEYLKEFDLEDECSAVLLFHKGNRVDEYEMTLEREEIAQTRWFSKNQRYDVVMVNDFPHPVNYYWFEEGKDERFSGTLEPGRRHQIGTFLGHLFTVRSTDGELLTWFVADGTNEIILKENPELHQCYEDVDSSITGQVCENVEDVLYEFAMSLWYNKRQELNAYQPRLVPEMTVTGFEKHRLPEETFKWLKAYYENSKQAKTTEGPVGPCLNQHISPTYMVHLNGHQKKRLDREIEPMLAAWSKRDDLVQTSIYGIREYTNGSVLRMHVDTVSTHVISAIINVAQSPGAIWPLQILDHDGNLHEVPMEAGDIVYYESARLLHGRERPLEGEYYANCFIHYKPESDWDFDWV